MKSAARRSTGRFEQEVDDPLLWEAASRDGETWHAI